MRKLLGLMALLLWTASAEAASYDYFCSKGYGRDAVLVVNKIGSASALYVKGDAPRFLFDQYQAFIGSIDPNDLKGTEVWVIEDRLFKPCKAPPWLKVTSVPGVIQFDAGVIRPEEDDDYPYEGPQK